MAEKYADRGSRLALIPHTPLSKISLKTSSKAKPMTIKSKKKLAPLSPRKKTPTTETAVETLETKKVAELTPETPTPETKAPAEGFSSDEIEAVTEDLGIEDETPAESVTVISGDTEKTEQTGPETIAEEAPSAEIISLAQREKDAKDLFYNVLCGSFDVANNRVSQGQPEGRYNSLDLKIYGETGRAGSDQFFDRLCDVPMIKRWLYKLNENALMEKWGAIFVLGYSVRSSFMLEHSARLKERSLRSEKEEPLKEKAA